MTGLHCNPIYTGYKENKPVNGINVEIWGALTQCGRLFSTQVPGTDELTRVEREHLIKVRPTERLA